MTSPIRNETSASGSGVAGWNEPVARFGRDSERRNAPSGAAPGKLCGKSKEGGRCSNHVFYKSRIPGARRGAVPCDPHLRPRRRCPQNPCACAPAHEDQADGQMVHIRLHLGLPLSGVYRIETKNGEGQRPLLSLSVLYAEAPSGANDIFTAPHTKLIDHLPHPFCSLFLVPSFQRVRSPPSAPRALWERPQVHEEPP